MSVTRSPRHNAIRRREQIVQAERDRLFNRIVASVALIGALFLLLAAVKS